MKTEYTKMKYYHIILPLLVACLLGACTAEGPEIKDMKASSYRVQLGARQRDFSITAKNGSVSVSVEANCSWTVTETSDDSGAFSCSPTKGEGSKTLNVTAADNTTVQERKASYRFTTADGVSMDFHVTQAAGDISLNVSTESITFESKEGTQTATFTVEANTDWTIVKDGPADWIVEISPASGKANIGSPATVTLKTNSERPLNKQDANLIVNATASGKTQTARVNVSRAGMETFMTVAQPSSTMSELGGTQHIEITTNTTWSAAVTKGAEFVTLATKEGSGNATVDLTFMPNESQEARTVEVTFLPLDGVSQLQAVWTMTQDAGTLPAITELKPQSTSRTTAAVTYAVASVSELQSVFIEYALADSPEAFEAAEKKTVSGNKAAKSGAFSLSDLTSGAVYYVRLTVENKVGRVSKLEPFETQSQPGKDDNTPPGLDDGE